MRFSIIVPYFNVGSLITSCVKSVLAQDYSDWELILVNDGSTDETAEFAKRAAGADKRIRYLTQENRGAFFARRHGLGSASGEYVMFLDADDELERNALSTVDEAIKRSDADLIIFCANAVYDDPSNNKVIGRVFETEREIEINELKEILISSCVFNSLALKAVKRVMFDGDETDYSAFEGSKWGEDKAQLLYPVSRASKAFFLPDELYVYKVRRGSTIRLNDGKQAGMMLAKEMFGLLASYMGKWGFTDCEHIRSFELYRVRHLVSVFNKTLRICENDEQRREFIGECRKEGLIDLGKKHLLRRGLTIEERARLVKVLLESR